MVVAACAANPAAYNAAMRVSLVARYSSHPTIDFGSGRGAAHRPRLGLRATATVYHRPRARLQAAPTVAALRSQTSRFRFPSVGRVGGVPVRRTAPPLGLPRARRA